MTARTWAAPALQEASDALIEARKVLHAAERAYLAGVSDRKAQEADEAALQRQNRSPVLVPKTGDRVEILNAISRADGAQVYRWITDSDLEQRRQALERAQADYDAAELIFDAARQTAQPVTEDEIKADARKAKASYATNKRLKIDGVTYPAGAPIPDKTLDSMPFWRVARWEVAGLIRRLTNG